MNPIETLPRAIEYKGATYFLSMHVTMFDHLCLCYKSTKSELGVSNTILDTVIHGYKQDYYRADDVEGVYEAVDMDEAVESLKTRLDKHFKVVEKVVEK